MSAGTNVIVSALVRRADGILLVEQKGPWDPQPSWMLPGGRVETGEALLVALERELAEETSRLRLVEWYDCFPIERYLSREAPSGTVYPTGSP